MRSALLLAGPRDGRITEGGTSSLRHVAETVGPEVDDLVVACSDDQRSAVAAALDGVSHRLAVDASVDGGPVAAVRTGARAATADSVAVVAGQASTVDARLLDDCFETCETAAVPRSDGRLHPLHAVYDTMAVRRASDRTLATGSRRLSDLLARLDPVEAVEAPDLDPDETRSARSPARTTPAGVVGD